MRKFVASLTAAALVSLAGVSSSAADGYGYGSVKDAPVAAPFSWSGAYFGVHAGYGFGDSKLTDNLPVIGGVALPTLSSSHEIDGFLGGLQLGARRQFGALVVGVELSASAGNINGSTGDCLGITSLIGAPAVANASCDSEVRWMSTALAKLGWAFNNWMVYGAAGWSVAKVEHNFAFSITPIPLTISSAQSDLADGFAVGGGVEFALGNGLSLGVEYLYRDLQHRGEGLLLGGVITTGDRDIELHSVTANLNIKW
jgi:outer membrane immunogenic protein